jgi:putative tricarboxylic transport membrane protein
VTRARLLSVVPHTLLLGVSVLLYWAASTIDASGAGPSRFGPAAWPRFIIVAMAALCLFEIVRRLASARPAASGHGPPASSIAPLAPADGEPTPGAIDGDEPYLPHHRMLAAGSALIVGFIVAVPWLGFFATTALFVAGFAWVGGVRRPVLAGSVGVVGAFVLSVIFMRVAYVSLPLGAGPFKDLSVGLLRLLGV